MSVDVFLLESQTTTKRLAMTNGNRKNTNRGMKNYNRDIENIHKEM